MILTLGAPWWAWPLAVPLTIVGAPLRALYRWIMSRDRVLGTALVFVAGPLLAIGAGFAVLLDALERARTWVWALLMTLTVVFVVALNVFG